MSTYFDTKTINSWNAVRANFGKPLNVNSGYRCQVHNMSKEVGGSHTSKHLYGLALDIDFEFLSMHDKEALKEYCTQAFEVVLEYPTFYHCHNEPASL